MAQGGVDERAGSGLVEQPAALAARSARGGMGVGFGVAGRIGRGRGAAARMVSGVLSLFRKVGFWPQPDGGPRRPGALFFHHRHASGVGPAGAGQGPAASAPPGRRGELLE